MEKFVIVTDSTTDLSNEQAKKMDLIVLPLSFQIKDDIYKNYLDEREMALTEFYRIVRSGLIPKTSQVNVNDYIEVLTKELKMGKDVLIITFSSALSGTYNAMTLAVKILKEEFPDRKIIGIDSLCASNGEGLLVHYAYLEKQNGKSIEEVANFIENIKLNVCHWFTVDDINHLRRGGRLSASSAFIAKTLNIKPILHVDNNGKLVPTMKKIGRKVALKALFEKMKELYNPDYKDVFISHADSLDDANYLAKLIKDNFDCKTTINFIGPVIGAHSGPGTIALFFIGKER